MKRKYFFTLMMMLAAALGVNAQENTYNMVIEMNNGTKITIGPNDVKDVSFNNGQLVISGPTIQQFISHTQMQVDSLGNEQLKSYALLRDLLQENSDRSKAEIYSLAYELERLRDSLQSNVNRLEAEIKAQQNGGGSGSGDYNYLLMRTDSLSMITMRLEDMIKQTDALHTYTEDELKARLVALEKYVSDNVNEFKERLAHLEQLVGAANARKEE